MGRVSALADDVPETEPGLDQRGVGVDVGTHHQDVARLEGGVVGQQPEQHLAQDVDLPGDSMACVHLHRTVGRVVDPAVGPGKVRREVGLQPAEERVRQRRLGFGGVGGDVGGGEGALELAGVASEPGQERMADDPVAVVVGPGYGAGAPAQRLPDRGDGCGSHTWTSRSRPRASSRPISVTDSRVWPNSESRVGRSNASGSSTQSVNGLEVALHGRRGVDAGDQPSPQLRLPGEVGGDRGPGAVGVSPCRPVGHQPRPLPGVRREQSAPGAARPRTDGRA